jgi:hypothetical protein
MSNETIIAIMLLIFGAIALNWATGIFKIKSLKIPSFNFKSKKTIHEKTILLIYLYGGLSIGLSLILGISIGVFIN